MENDIIQEFALNNLPSNICALTGKNIVEPAVMHRDLSDWWPENILDMRDERLINLLIVERSIRDHYYNKLKRAGVVLSFSGGLDSTTVLHWCLRLFGKVHCMIFDYGQRHKIELDKAVLYLNDLIENNNTNVEISYERINMGCISNLAPSALTRLDQSVPHDRNIDDMSSDIPETFVPGRNVYFITALAQYAYASGWRHIAMGVNQVDYSGYPDCRPEFLESMRKSLSIGIFNGQDIGVHAPLMYLDKSQIIRLGNELNVDYSKTHSCYEGVDGGCGKCDSCILRRKAFEKIGIVDPSIQN